MTGAPKNLPELALARTRLDRAGWRRKEPGLLATLLSDPDTVVLEMRADRVETCAGGARLVLHRASEAQPDPDDLAIYLGQGPQGTQHIGIVRAPHPDDGALPDRWQGLRALGLTLDPLEVALVAGLTGIAHWHHNHGWCSRCGEPTQVEQAGWVRRCAEGHESFPATSPAVIMAVTDDQDRLLLARNAGWPEGRMSVLAGFVEPGEALEAAVAREVAEEVGIKVVDIAYVGNQPWPFPASLMLAFRARATSTRLTFADAEIAEARWFTREELSAEIAAGTVLSGGTPVSVAYHLIETWLGTSIASHRQRDLTGPGLSVRGAKMRDDGCLPR